MNDLQSAMTSAIYASTAGIEQYLAVNSKNAISKNQQNVIQRMLNQGSLHATVPLFFILLKLKWVGITQ